MEPPRGKSICVPFDSEEHYAACDGRSGELPPASDGGLWSASGAVPTRMSEGFVLHDKSWSIKQQVMLRRLELKRQPRCSWSGLRS